MTTETIQEMQAILAKAKTMDEIKLVLTNVLTYQTSQIQIENQTPPPIQFIELKDIVKPPDVFNPVSDPAKIAMIEEIKVQKESALKESVPENYDKISQEYDDKIIKISTDIANDSNLAYEKHQQDLESYDKMVQEKLKEFNAQTPN